MRGVWVMGALLGVVGCDGGTAEPQVDPMAEAQAKCPKVHIDKLAGDWIAVKGNSGDPKTRLRIVETDEGYEAFYVGGFFTKLALEVDKRESDLKLTEVPSASKQARVASGEETLTRLYAEPKLKTCSLHVNMGRVDKDDKEQVEPKAVEFLPFPDQGVTFSYQPPAEKLFLGEAASDADKAAAELEELGGPKADHELGTVPVGMFSDVATDGDEACTYDMDLYFDDQLVTELSPVSAGEVVDGRRPWFHSWEAPYSGNHNFEMYRYRTCEGGPRELIAIAGIEAVLI